jgi:hypothetical protein
MMDRRSRMMCHRRRCRVSCRMIHHRCVRSRWSHIMARSIIRPVRRRSTRKPRRCIRRMIRRRPRYRRIRRPPVVHRRKLIPVDAGIMLL